MGDLVATTKTVIARDNFGRFLRECEIAGELTVQEAVEEGAKISKALAPRGKKKDTRSPTKLWRSIQPYMLTPTSGGWGSDHRAALPQEYGTRPHKIPGNPDLHFWWHRMGRYFVASRFYYFNYDYYNDEYFDIRTGESVGPERPMVQTVVRHPGHKAQPFLGPAYKIMMSRIMDIAKKHYPGT
jgi:hypothetical protein